MREKMEEFLKEMADQVPYEQRKVKGSFQRHEKAAELLKRIR